LSKHGGLGKAETIIAAAAAHHWLLWIHPFLDGNGRVARLMSHAMLLEALDTGGIWSIARGLARNVNSYKSHLAACYTDEMIWMAEAISARKVSHHSHSFSWKPALIK
jgi:Fic family protein